MPSSAFRRSIAVVCAPPLSGASRRGVWQNLIGGAFNGWPPAVVARPRLAAHDRAAKPRAGWLWGLGAGEIGGKLSPKPYTFGSSGRFSSACFSRKQACHSLSDRRYSTRAPENLTTLAHFSVSAAT